MNDQLEAIKYEAFFDELGRIEKKAMLEKVAGVSPGFVSQLVRGGRQIVRRPQNALKAMQKAYGRGSLLQGAGGAGRAGQVLGGLKEMWRTPQGKAALVGGAGTVGAIGGAGYLIGRGRGSQNQNVYVR